MRLVWVGGVVVHVGEGDRFSNHDHDVDDWFGGEAGHGGATYVLDGEEGGGGELEVVFEVGGDGFELLGPVGVVGGDSELNHGGEREGLVVFW